MKRINKHKDENNELEFLKESKRRRKKVIYTK